MEAESKDVIARALARDLIKKHEGFSQYLYHDTRGIATVGYGRNLVNQGVSKEEADWLLMRDIVRAAAYLSSFPFWNSLNAERQAVLIDMAFNLGDAGFDEFTRTIALLADGDYPGAAHEMLDSEWARQVPTRAAEDAQIIERGVI